MKQDDYSIKSFSVKNGQGLSFTFYLDEYNQPMISVMEKGKLIAAIGLGNKDIKQIRKTLKYFKNK